jgi:hypothetical protein
MYILIGILILVLEFSYRWINQTYQIHIRTCPDVISIELKQLKNIQSVSWLENQINKFVEALYSINDQCSTKELKLNFQKTFIFLRFLWLGISSLYICFALIMKLKKY